MDRIENSSPETSKDREVPARHNPAPRIGLWGWAGLYATGGVLFFLLLSHVWLVHHAPSEAPSWNRTTVALRSPAVRIIEVGLLLFALIHGMTGMRRVILDLEILKAENSAYMMWILAGITGLLFVWGYRVFGRLVSM